MFRIVKTIVTHFAPDVDAVASVWLLKRFLPGWEDAEVAFVGAGKILNDNPVDSDPDIMHVDTGLGMLDHHQTDEDTCAAKRTMEYIRETQNLKKKIKSNFPDEAMVRMIDVVNDIDHFREVYFPNASADYYDLGLVSELDGLKLIYPDDHHKLIDFGLLALDGIYKNFQNKVWAEEEIKKEGIEFKTKWGTAIGMETINDEVIRIAQRRGYIIAVRKDPKKNYVRIKAQPNSKADFTKHYRMFMKKDPEATWFLHASKKMLLNGSMKNPETKPTTLSLREIIDILKS